MTLSRRAFLKLAALSALAWWPGSAGLAASAPNGRVTAARVAVRREPSHTADRVRWLYFDRLITAGAPVPGLTPADGPALWLPLNANEFVYGGDIQPVTSQPQPVQTTLPQARLGEITVPWAQGRAGPRANSALTNRLYFGSVHWVLEARPADNQVWYRLWREQENASHFVPGEQVRLLAPADYAPLPAQGERRLVVDTAGQQVMAEEAGREVFRARCATGLLVRQADGSLKTSTPLGDFAVWLKRPSRHMRASEQNTGYDLPGVPWFAMFNDYGIGFHGVYWHNDFGRPRSHGCVNLSNADALWVYRWSLPLAPATARVTANRREVTAVQVR